MKFIHIAIIGLLLFNLLFYGLIAELSVWDRVKMNLALALVAIWRWLIDGNFEVRWRGTNHQARQGVLASRLSEKTIKWTGIFVLITVILSLNSIIGNYL